MTVDIDLKNLGCKMGQRYLLKDINWTINHGEHWLVFGMNGCGKTTLLTIIAGFRSQTHGNVKIFGEEYSKENIFTFRKRLALVSGSFFNRVYSEEKTIDIVLSGKFGTLGLNYDITNEDIRRAKDLLRELNLKKKINTPFRAMSNGERQNVLIARAFMSKPEVLLLDEPGTGLDVVARERLLTMVRKLANNTNITIVYVTHYVEEILSEFDKCMMMKNGHGSYYGTTAEIFNDATLSDFLELPVKLTRQNGRMQLIQHATSNILQFVK